MYGTQTFTCFKLLSALFENDVEMYGTRTVCIILKYILQFENDVKMYGTQTPGSVKASVCNHYFE